MNFESWAIDLVNASAIHESGFKLTVEGDLTNPMGVHPGKFPDGLTAIEQARLLRCGLEAMIRAAQSKAHQHSREVFAERIALHKPKRPLLSLKKSQ